MYAEMTQIRGTIWQKPTHARCDGGCWCLGLALALCAGADKNSCYVYTAQLYKPKVALVCEVGIPKY